MKKGLLVTASILFSLAQAFGQIPLAEEKVVVANERRVNSGELEFSPVFYKDGIVFTTTRHETLLDNVKDLNMGGMSVTSIYHSRRDEEGFLGAPEPLAAELLFKFHDGPVTFDKTASAIFFTRNEPVVKAPDTYLKLQIYGSQMVEGVWENVQKLPFNNVEFNYCHPAISVENDVLIIASDVPGGYGGMDLYAVRRSGEVWEQMINLGEQVNTPGNEVFPYLSADGVLYFASDGQGGYGGLDIFYATAQEGIWEKPVNLTTPFNSPGDDFGFIVDVANKNGYFSSDRPGGFGGDDIYSFYIEGDVMPLADANNKRNLDGFVVVDEDGNPLEGVTVTATNLGDVSLSAGNDRVVKLRPGVDGGFILDVNSNGIGKSVVTGPDGKVNLDLEPGSYVLKLTKDGYIPEYVPIAPTTDLSDLKVVMRKKKDCIALTGNVYWKVGGSPVSGASVSITDATSGEAITVYTDEKGYYEYCVPCHRNYLVFAVKNGQASPTGNAKLGDASCEPGMKLDLPLYMEGSEFFADMTIELPNIYFNFDDDKLRPDAYKDLNEVIGIMRSNPGMSVELGSHTDSRGDRLYNQDLSDRRSANVFKYLSTKGITGERLVTKGYGESKIRNRCVDGVKCADAEHQVNRRTEIRIIEVGASPIAVNKEIVPPPTPQGEKEEPEDGIADTAPGEDGEQDAGKGGQDPGNAPGTNPEESSTNNAVNVGQTGKPLYAVVAGTFANHDYAVRRANLLSEMGYAAVIVQQSGNNLYAVWVKTFEEKREAMAMMRQLAQRQLHSYLLRK